MLVPATVFSSSLKSLFAATILVIMFASIDVTAAFDAASAVVV